MISRLLFFFLITGLAGSYSQHPDSSYTGIFPIVFYNVENLFDTIDEPFKNDDEFAPEGSKHWNTKRYYKKLNDISRVLTTITRPIPPAIMGFAEVENEKVLNDLFATGSLDTVSYGFAMTESRDIRGIDVALAWNTKRFDVIYNAAITVKFPFDTAILVRDILYVKGIIEDSDTLHIFVNHWKSRYGGKMETEPCRLYTAQLLKRIIDSVQIACNDARIIIMGDFNDEPTDKSLYSILQAGSKRKNIRDSDLYNLYYDIHNLNNGGTYYYKGNWNMLDNIIISCPLLTGPGYHTDFDSGRICKQDFMMYYDRDKEVYIPNRTYGGNYYFGGISDHLPVYFELNKE